MLVYRLRFACVFFVAGFIFAREVSMVNVTNYTQTDTPESKCAYNYLYNATSKKTWEAAKQHCRDRKADLLNFRMADKKFLSCVNASLNGIWIGMRKNASNVNEMEIRLANTHDVFTTAQCESRSSNLQFENISCTELLSPICFEKGQGNRTCYRFLYDKMTWTGAFMHCSDRNYTMENGRFSVAYMSSNNESSWFWTRRRYETKIHDAKWTWQNGTSFTEWDTWNIVIADVGCDGCGFWKNGTIFLASNCSQGFSYFCEEDRKGNINSSRNAEKLFWKNANETCSSGLLQFLDNATDNSLLNNGTFIQKNMSYWLGIYKNSRCTTRLVENRKDLTDIQLENCSYLTNFSQRFGNCSDMNYAVCVKASSSSGCHTGNHQWKKINNGSCGRVFSRTQMTWKAAVAFCLQQDGQLANLSEIQSMNKTSFSRLDDKLRYWIRNTMIKVYRANDPLQGWYWLDGTEYNQYAQNVNNDQRWRGALKNTDEKERCAAIDDTKSRIWKSSHCNASRRFICKKNPNTNGNGGSMV